MSKRTPLEAIETLEKIHLPRTGVESFYGTVESGSITWSVLMNESISSLWLPSVRSVSCLSQWEEERYVLGEGPEVALKLLTLTSDLMALVFPLHGKQDAT